MELKLKKEIIQIIIKVGSNRTFMELKYDELLQTCPSRYVLIVPLWN